MLEGGDVSYCTHQCALGQLVLAADSQGRVLACSFDTEEQVTNRLAELVSPRVLREPAKLDILRTQLDEYLAGRRRKLDLARNMALAVTWTIQVLEVVDQVPYGETTTYASVARSIGMPNASRAVGNALAANPLCILVPCHRVLRSDGQLGGYAGGAEAKEALLRLESEGTLPLALSSEEKGPSSENKGPNWEHV